LLRNEHDTTIIIGLGNLYPGGGVARIDYSVGGQSIVCETREKAEGFRRAARDIGGMLAGAVPRFGPQHMVEASILLDLFAHAEPEGKDYSVQVQL
ncbi:MAG: hypothetical protein IH899_07545, partial [Planctomycetes bacterium]|nr:hypothetical protein [Planctomycetota bacterium]